MSSWPSSMQVHIKKAAWCCTYVLPLTKSLPAAEVMPSALAPDAGDLVVEVPSGGRGARLTMIRPIRRGQ
jgi:hypothetical protein